LPPSEGKADGGGTSTPFKVDSGQFGAALGPQRSLVIKQLIALGGGDQKLLGVKGVHLELARAKNQRILGSPCMPAWQRYTGVVWDHLDLGSLSESRRNQALQHILIPSGLLGLISASDLIPNYKLKMGARIAPFGALNAWWRDSITDCLAPLSHRRQVIDLLPQEHRTAINWAQISSVIRINLVSKTGGIVGGHNAKAAKGLLARHIIDAGNQDITKIVASFQHVLYSAVIAE